MLRFFRFRHGGDLTATPTSTILSRRVVAAVPETAEALGLPTGASVLELERLRSLDGEPCLLEQLWLPLPAFDALKDSDPATWGDLLYPLFAARLGVHVQRAVDTIGFGSLAAGQARALQLPPGHPCARVQRQAFDLAGRCVEWRSTLGDANAFHYTVAIT